MRARLKYFFNSLSKIENMYTKFFQRVKKTVFRQAPQTHNKKRGLIEIFLAILKKISR